MEDRTLLDGLALKDPQCFETLVDRYSRYIAAVVAKVAGGRFNSYDVEEITGDVLVKLWTDGPKIMLRGDSIKPYLAIAARNHTLNVLRKDSGSLNPNWKMMRFLVLLQRHWLFCGRRRKRLAAWSRIWGTGSRNLHPQVLLFGESPRYCKQAEYAGESRHRPDPPGKGQTAHSL